MDYRQLGRSGLKVSPLCLGTMMFGGQTDEATAARSSRRRATPGQLHRHRGRLQDGRVGGGGRRRIARAAALGGGHQGRQPDRAHDPNAAGCRGAG